MNNCVDRFQEFNEHFRDGVKYTPMVDLSKIDSVPLSFFVSVDDETCSYDHAVQYIPEFGVDISLNIIQEGGHSFYDKVVPDSFVIKLIEELQVPSVHDTVYNQ